MAGLHFELVSPAKLLFSGDVASVTIPGSEGDMGILAGHAPVLATLRPGVVTVTRDSGAAERIFVRGGFADVTPEGLTILAEEAILLADLSAERIASEIKDAEEDVADAKDAVVRDRAQTTLTQLRELRGALG